MRVNHIKNSNKYNTFSFKAGVTNFYSDFDGTFMPYQYRHDVFCNNEFNSPRHEFLKNGKNQFMQYFESFKKFIQTAKGKNDDKFNFTITSGRNRPEYNYFMTRIREDGLSVPLPDRLVIRNGGDIYTRRKDIEDFFNSSENEVFLKTDFSKAKRDEIKKLTNGWDGDEIRDVIRKFLEISEIEDNSLPIKGLSVFEADTDGWFYGKDMSVLDKLKSIYPSPTNYAAFKDNGNLEFQIKFPHKIGDKATLEIIEKSLKEKLTNNGVSIYSKIYESKKEKDLGEINFAPLIDGKKINKVFDTKLEVQNIIKNGLNDLVVVAGDDSNDIRMLNLFEYINNGKGTPEVFDLDNLKQIYDLPFISIFVDNSKNTKRDMLKSHKDGIPYDKIDNYFNSDGNVRFIHVIPDNTVGKPKTLQEAVQIAIREYAKRNEEFRKQLPKEMQNLIDNMEYEYPIDRNISKELEEKLHTKLWNPVSSFEKQKNNSSVVKKIGVISLIIGMIAALGVFILKNIKKKKQEKKFCKL